MIQTENSQTSSGLINMAPLILPCSVLTNSAEETFLLGKRLSLMLKKGSVVALQGAVGAGKTCLSKGISKGAGITEELTSPSYTIISEYEALLDGEIIPFYHIDAYRLNGNADFSAIGGEEIVFGNGISVIEWSERLPDFISTKAIKVDIKILGDNKRSFYIYE